MFLLAASACKKSEKINYITFNYSGAGTIGDVLTFSVNESVIGYKARDMGGRIASNICYTVMVIVGYIKLSELLGL